MDSLRVRTTTGAVVVVGVALVIAAAAMLVILRRSLTDNVRTTALQRADAVGSFISSGAFGNPTRGMDDDEFVQVLDDRGRIVLASSNAEDRPMVDDLGPGESREIDVPFEDDPFLAVATEDRQGNHLIVVGRTLDEVLESTEVVRTLLLVGAPLLLLFVGRNRIDLGSHRLDGGQSAPHHSPGHCADEQQKERRPNQQQCSDHLG